MKHRRMLPTDIPQCLMKSDIYSVVRQRGIETEMIDFLTKLLLNDQQWGSVVEAPNGNLPVCFGSGIFIDEYLTEGLRKGKFPFLLADLCQSENLRHHILSFDEIKKNSKAYKLNFYGGLFAFPSNPFGFGTAMYHLQRSLVNSISGFGLAQYFKQCYGKHFVTSQLTSAAMRFKFGANLIVDYRNNSNIEVKQHLPLLFASTKDEAIAKPALPIYELMCGGDTILNLPPAVRMLLKLEIEGYSHESIHQALLKEVVYHKGSHDNSWNTAVEKVRRSPEIFDFLGMGEEEASLRDCIREYVRQNPQELGILPLLTPEEKEHWKKYKNLDSVAMPNRGKCHDKAG